MKFIYKIITVFYVQDYHYVWEYINWRQEELDNSGEIFPFGNKTLGPSKPAFRNEQPSRNAFVSNVVNVIRSVWRRITPVYTYILEKIQTGYRHISTKINLGERIHKCYYYMSEKIKPLKNRIAKVFPQHQENAWFSTSSRFKNFYYSGYSGIRFTLYISVYHFRCFYLKD